MMEVLFSELTVWHWLGLALLLLAIEMTIGTFDLLWMAIAAGATAVFASVAPTSASGWVWECGFFALTSVILVVAGRKLFAGRGEPPETHPTLNNKNASLVGMRAVVTGGFQEGYGRVKINDSEWRAELETGADINIGDSVIIVSAQGSTVKIKAV